MSLGFERTNLQILHRSKYTSIQPVYQPVSFFVTPPNQFPIPAYTMYR